MSLNRNLSQQLAGAALSAGAASAAGACGSAASATGAAALQPFSQQLLQRLRDLQTMLSAIADAYN